MEQLEQEKLPGKDEEYKMVLNKNLWYNSHIKVGNKSIIGYIKKKTVRCLNQKMKQHKMEDSNSLPEMI